MMGSSQSLGPFYKQLSESAYDDPSLQRAAQSSGWASTGGQIAYIANNFLKGVQQGRLQRFALDEAEKDRKWRALSYSLDTAMKNPDLTPAGRAELERQAALLNASRVAVATKDQAKHNPVVGILHNIAVGMTGGALPKGQKDIDPGSEWLKISDNLMQNPAYSKKATLEQADSAYHQAFTDALQEAGGDQSRLTKDLILKHVQPIVSNLANSLGQESAVQWATNKTIGYPANIGEAASNAVDRYRMHVVGGLMPPPSTPPPPSQISTPAAPGQAATPQPIGEVAPPAAAAAAPPAVMSRDESAIRKAMGLPSPEIGQTQYVYPRGQLGANPIPVQSTVDTAGNQVWVHAGTNRVVQGFDDKYSTEKPKPPGVTIAVDAKNRERYTQAYIDPETNKAYLDSELKTPLDKSKWVLGLSPTQPDHFAQHRADLANESAYNISSNYQANNARMLQSYDDDINQIAIRLDKADATPQENDALRQALAMRQVQKNQAVIAYYDSTLQSIQRKAKLAGMPADEVKSLIPEPPPQVVDRDRRQAEAQTQAPSINKIGKKRIRN